MKVFISGKKGSGKDEVAKVLARSFQDFTSVPIVSFADPLKALYTDLYGVSVTEEMKRRRVAFNHEVQENFIEVIKCYPEGETLGKRIISVLGFRYFGTQRRVLQLLGTEVGRSIDEDYWVKLFKDGLDALPYFVCPGVRFPNEVKIIEEFGEGALHIHIVRPGYSEGNKESDSHESESYEEYLLDNAHEVIHNDGTLEELIKKAKKLAYEYEL